MRDDLTDISIVLDRSGSMQSVKADTIGGFNARSGNTAGREVKKAKHEQQR